MAPLSSKTFSEIEPLVIAQHESSVDLLTYGDLKDGIRLPGLPETLDILGENLTSAQIQEILQMQEAALLIEPQKPFTDFMRAIKDSQKNHSRQTPFLVLYSIQQRLAAMLSSRGVRVGFAEGHAVPVGDPILMGKEIKAQGTLVKARLADGESIIHPRSYALLQVKGRQQGEVLVDSNSTHSMLDDGSTDRLPYITANRRMFHNSIYEGPSTFECTNARWRRAVMVDRAE